MDENSSTMDSLSSGAAERDGGPTGTNEDSVDSEINEKSQKRRINHRIIDDDDDDDEQLTSEPAVENNREKSNDGLNSNQGMSDDEEDDQSIDNKADSPKVNRRIIDDDDESVDDDASDVPKSNLRIIDDEDETSESFNNSKVVMKNLKSLCDDESSDEEGRGDNREDEEEEGVRNGLDSSEDSSRSNEGPPEAVERPKNPARASKTECENAISIIQKNAREDLIDVPYHCPEQKSLKEFLASLKCNKSKLITEEKVEKKTMKFKLLRDLPRMDLVQKGNDHVNENPNPENESFEQLQPDTEIGIPTIEQRSFGSAKLTLKGEANSMIDLETGQTFKKKTIADTLILQLMKNGGNRAQSNNPKFKPEPIPGAPLKALKRTLESQLDQKRKETILKILEVEKVAKEDEEEILDDDEYEVDYESDKKRKVVKERSDEEKSELVNQSVFNEDEEEVPGDEVEDEGDAEDDENDDDEPGNDEEHGEEDSEEEDESSDDDDDDDQLDQIPEGKRTLKRIVAMVDSDEEDLLSTQTQPGEGLNVDVVTEPAPLFEDIPTEGPKSYEFSATQNETELFDLCSGKFTTQLPQSEAASQVEASQVRDFELPSNISIEMTNDPVVEEKIVEEDKSEAEDKTVVDDNIVDEDVAGPQKFNLSSSEDENEGEPEKIIKKIKLKRKKKRIVIEDEDEEDDDLPNEGEDLGEEEEEDEEGLSDTDLPQEAVEELEEYEQFLTTQGASDPKPMMRVTDFIEKEAEMSDSEWGSEDEDERGLDQIEDIGLVRDDENFDGEQLRDEVGRIHMRQMANEDNRELKYLKDMILNEEELDGQARQRTFRWLNVNNEDDFEKEKTEGNADDIADLENHSSDEENEEKWRKIRYEREQTILENKDGLTMKSKLESVMRLTKDIKVIKSVNSGDVTAKEIVSPSFLMQDQSKKYMNLRQSFLLRDEETLSRLASISAKDCGSAVTDGKQNFVFRRIEEPNTAPSAEPLEPKKRKSNGFPFGDKSNPVQKKRKV